jgi:uncharacterized membrane protein YsdA (DUF1294 family)/cold shock CspA family protein
MSNVRRQGILIPMRFEGTLKTWNDDRGFGFIEPIQGGQEIFVHIKAFGPRGARPQVQQLLSFEIEVGPQGKRAKNVEFVRGVPPRTRARRESPAEWGTVTLFVVAVIALPFVAVAVLWKPPLVLGAVYAGASLLAFLAYAIDKSAARRGAWRTSEATLHLLAVAGGWPGALVAQHVLRHKSAKAEFRRVFWGTVVVNAAVFILLCSPVGRPLWAPQ